VTITGTELNTTTAVKFGDADATSFTINSDTSITAIAPAGAIGTVDITVTTVGGTSTTSVDDQFTYGTVPSITSLSPTSGSVNGGTIVRIHGSNFTNVTTVTFGNAAATTFTIDSDTQITARSPAGPVGAVDVIVSNEFGDSDIVINDQFTYLGSGSSRPTKPSSFPRNPIKINSQAFSDAQVIASFTPAITTTQSTDGQSPDTAIGHSGSPVIEGTTTDSTSTDTTSTDSASTGSKSGSSSKSSTTGKSSSSAKISKGTAKRSAHAGGTKLPSTGPHYKR
jgi:hypothetical protein